MENLENARKMKEYLEDLANKIPNVVSLKVYYDSLSTSDADIILISEFKSEEDLKAYIDHPEHKKVVEFNKTVAENRRCFDFFIKEGE
ncbi:MAG: Dabb family protein [Oscillospiraceae bacterium]|nr:Dabb family protein [Oscillospiraceae bacterium]